MRESKKAKQERLSEALARLNAAYPDVKPMLEYRTAFELLVAVILSAQCTDKQVNKCTRELFAKYSAPEDFAKLPEQERFGYIRGCGLYQTKGRNIIKAAKMIEELYGGEVPRTREELMKLPGVGRKTANVVLANAFNVNAIAVDTHVFRVANRIGFAKASDVLNTEKQLMKNIPERMWSKAHHWLIYHGRGVCSARSPKCGDCTLNTVCEEYRRAKKQ